MKLAPEQLEAIVHLLQGPDFMVFLRAIGDECSKLNEMLIKRPEGSEYLRGQVYALSVLIETVNEATKKLELAKQPKR